MNTEERIEAYITGQAEPKCNDMQALHHLMLHIMPVGRLWFSDGKNSDGKTISNPSIGYGARTITYEDGKTKEFYQIGISANSTGISVYILGIDDKHYLPQTYGKTLGKASVSSYCIKFKRLNQIDINTLEEAIRYGIETTRDE
ncbi:hypothetical protein [Spirosoma endophyticum]|uniref:YdhG-like domain-containing protein n=1 Tax=Spirosoma endophyticum TaxID=662367 RepID=A0A1I2GRL4_9BACT|nr:hypothetical protein [Spirosoma endophyticum]SFF19689.1 hypothetical protein SAMN05216167_13442 [Spirosoma endophyticum]